jgi:hypothetical protein
MWRYYRRAKPSSSTNMKNNSAKKSPIHLRLKAIIQSETEETGRFTWLQKWTEISRNTWQTWWDKDDAPPSGKMIEAAARLWPKYAFWLASGLSDEKYGHTYPKSLSRTDTWPELETVEKKRASDYFLHCIKMQQAQFGEQDAYRSERKWTEDWSLLGALSWMREAERESFEKVPCEERIKAKKGPFLDDNYSPWWPDVPLAEDDSET